SEVYTSSILLEEKSCENRINEAIFKRAKVLVVDDIELNIELVKGFFLKNKNMVFDDALSGEEAVEKVKTNDYDLIIMDIAMGIMDGLEASKIIKSIKNYTYNHFNCISSQKRDYRTCRFL
ncbi:response regulator, partial [Sulfurimonas sp.]|uniref:response regulator n=1 Tax=Sulfurimonas sp. TaxID=2022749 RepID=UPI002612B4F9